MSFSYRMPTSTDVLVATRIRFFVDWAAIGAMAAMRAARSWATSTPAPASARTWVRPMRWASSASICSPVSSMRGGVAGADRTGEELRRPGPAVPAPADLAGGEAGGGFGDAHVGRARQLEPAADAVAEQGGDDRLAHVPQPVHVVLAGIHAVAVLPVGAVLVEVADVAAGAERLAVVAAGAGEHHRSHGVVERGVAARGVELLVHRDRHRVQLLRAVDGDRGDPVADLVADGAHAVVSSVGAGRVGSDQTDSATVSATRTAPTSTRSATWASS